MSLAPNLLYYGDNLDVLRERVATASVDLVYIDPPFNSNRAYNVIFAQHDVYDSGEAAQIEAFDDTWHWTPETDAHYKAAISGGVPAKAADALTAMRTLLGENDATAYLVNMAPRLVELHRVLKATGSLYLHCDPTMSHYLKMMLDAIFGPTNFRSEIVWRRTGAHGKTRRFGPVHDTIFFYSKSNAYTWNGARRPYMCGHVEEYFVEDARGWRTNYYGNVLTGSGLRGGESGKPWRGIDPSAKGRHWAIPGALLDEVPEDLSGLGQHEKMDRLFDLGLIKLVPGQAWPMYEHYITPEDGLSVSDIWAFQPYTGGTVFGTERGVDEDVRWLSPRDQERLGYPTQKPEGLLDRILRASSNPGDVVLDSFCGCGTTVAVAQRLGRHWIGIDITYLAVDLIEKRLRHTFGPTIAGTYAVQGIPRDLLGAQALFIDDPLDFERWAVSLVNGTPNEKQVGDKGIDGVIRFFTDAKGGTGRALVSVKGGKTVNPAFVRDLLGTVQTQNAEMGVLVTITKPTPGMNDAADHASTYTWPVNGENFPKIQLVTIADLLAGNRPKLPPTLTPYIKAQKFTAPPDQMSLG